jgi:hypothetical protein
LLLLICGSATLLLLICGSAAARRKPFGGHYAYTVRKGARRGSLCGRPEPTNDGIARHASPFAAAAASRRYSKSKKKLQPQPT